MAKISSMDEMDQAIVEMRDDKPTQDPPPANPPTAEAAENFPSVSDRMRLSSIFLRPSARG